MIIRENVPLAPLTTLGVGGPARYFLEAQTQDDIVKALKFARERDLPLFVMGRGSNLVVADAGFNGVVVRVRLSGIEREKAGEEVLYRVAAGEEWDSFVLQSVQEGCAGLECLSGIPGFVGATPVQNVGAYGQEVAKTIVGVSALDRQTLEVREFTNSHCGFGYRSSIFNEAARGHYIILSVSFALRHGGAPSLRYTDLQKAFAGYQGRPSLFEVRNAVLDIRRHKSMVLDSGDENSHSVGSFFKNPVIPVQHYEELDATLRSRGVVMPTYPAGDAMRKLSAAWLVEQAGFHKGYSRGAAAISRKHALAIVNRGTATAAEIVALKNEIQARVLAEFGIELIPEPVSLGF